MRTRNILLFSGAMFVSAVAGSLVGPRPALAVAREIIELQRDVTTLLQGQKDMQTQMTQDHTVPAAPSSNNLPTASTSSTPP